MFAALRTASLLNRAAREQYASHRRAQDERAAGRDRLHIPGAPSARQAPEEPDVDEALWHMDDPAIVTERCNKVLARTMVRFDAVEAALSARAKSQAFALAARSATPSPATWAPSPAAAPAPAASIVVEAEQAAAQGAAADREASRLSSPAAASALAEEEVRAASPSDVFLPQPVHVDGTSMGDFVQVVSRKQRRAREAVSRLSAANHPQITTLTQRIGTVCCRSR